MQMTTCEPLVVVIHGAAAAVVITLREPAATTEVDELPTDANVAAVSRDPEVEHQRHLGFAASTNWRRWLIGLSLQPLSRTNRENTHPGIR